MSRAFDNWNSYLDNDGNLLHGKIRFCRKETTDNITIYNSDSTAIRNPEFTDLLGRTEYQVFLDSDENVTAYFYKYVGTGDMTRWPYEDYDPSRWAYQYSSDNMDPTSKVSITSDTASGVATMVELRDVDPDDVPEVNGAKLMWLYGYYDAGDKSPVLYVWDSASLDSDDGGATIMANSVPGRGRWKLATRELHFDVRHFGIFPLDDKYSTDYSFTSQLANCAAYIDKEGLDAWFPAINDNMSYYLFDGTNTFGIKGDIYVSDSVRFQVKSGTNGTAISCHEIHKQTPYLFDSSLQTGLATLSADWVCISWVGGNCTGNARVGWVIDTADFSRIITGKEVKFVANGSPSLQLDDCVITSNKKITGRITIMNSIVKTDFFADDYDWTRLTLANNTILIENCKDANTYILLKNKQGDNNYGDLHEQSIDADVLSGGLIENCSGKIRFISNGETTEMHNVSLEVSGLTSIDSLNLIDSWLTFSENSVIGGIQIRRGELAGYVELQILASSMIENVDVRCQIKALSNKLTVRNSNIHGAITARDIDLVNNQLYAQVEQLDNNGVVNVHCVGNMFHSENGIPARHYVHATNPGSTVNGIWSKNGSSYDTVHWIRLDRTNLKLQDSEHSYSYTGNAEPYMMKWSGRGHPLMFARFRGHWSPSSSGTDVFSGFSQPFLFYNDRERSVTVVPKASYWKMFTVGKNYLMRTGRIVSGTDLAIGIMEGDYSDYDNGYVTPTWTWGCTTAALPTILGGNRFGYMRCVSRDGDGEADFNVSFEAADEAHGPFSYGPTLGYYPSDDFDSSALASSWPVYPSEVTSQATLFVMVDPDFSTGSNPMGYNP